MDSLSKAILATIIYYDALDWPLHLLEIYRYLINPSRVSLVNGGIESIEVADIRAELERLERQGKLAQKWGWYFLPGRNRIVESRRDRMNESDQKWKRLLRYVKWFSLVPFLRGAFVSGSMALNNVLPQSDYDMLVIGQAGRLYTMRLVLAGLASLLGIRRTKDQSIAPDKFCFNHFLADSHLEITHHSLFNAQTYIHLKPTVMVDRNLTDRFFKANNWLNAYVYHAGPPGAFIRRAVSINPVFRKIARLGELILNGKFGQWVESKARVYQQNRIAGNPATHQSGGRIIYTDNELEFHPHSFEKTVLARYIHGLAKAGIVPPIEEKDSGLKE